MNTEPPLELFVWPGCFGLASLSPECLQVITYMKFVEVPFETKFENSTYDSFPILKEEEYMVYTNANIVEHLRFKRYSLDFGLGSKACSELVAFSNLVYQLLNPVMQYVFWIDDRNYEELTKKWYMKILPMFKNLMFCKKSRSAAESLIKTYFPVIEDNLSLRHVLRKSAIECFDILSLKLKENKYFYGNTPSSLDALMYSYLAPILKIPFPNDEIRKLLEKYTKLVKYVEQIDKHYFPDISKKTITFFPGFSGKNEEITTSGGTKIVALILITCAMLGYAFKTKTIDVPGSSKLPIK